MIGDRDWYDWHLQYADPAHPLSGRLRVVQRHIHGWLDRRAGEQVGVVSICAGQGRDLLEVLAARPDRDRVCAHLLELDERNVAAACVAAAGLAVSVSRADAGDLASYRGLVPADLVLLVGVLGNITEADIRRTIETLPELCARNATVIWTRTRQPPDLTPAIRDWFAAAGFAEHAFEAPHGVLYSVGVHELRAPPRPLSASGRIFRFVV